MDKESIRNFIIEELLDDDDEEITFDMSLFKDQVLNSLNLLSLISFLEEKDNVKIATSEINYENLDTINNIFDFLERKLNDHRHKGGGFGEQGLKK